MLSVGECSPRPLTTGDPPIQNGGDKKEEEEGSPRESEDGEKCPIHCP